jgi:1-acyl-sn-glycerol-3-phosphate acyltransferase
MFLFLTAGLTLVLFFIVTLPLLIVLELVRLRNPVAASKVAQPVVKAGFNAVLFFAGSKVIKLGLENVPKDTPVMFAANHRGLLDAALAYASLPVQTGIVSKKELRKIPFLSWWMDLCCCFFLDRKDPRSGIKMILQSIENINNGISMFIAPEGTRSKTREMNPFKEGSFKISTKSGCPIVPVAISGADDIFENHKPFIKRATAVIEYGKPIYLTDLSDEELKFVGAHTQKIVAQMLEGHERFLTKNPSRVAERKAGAAEKDVEK